MCLFQLQKQMSTGPCTPMPTVAESRCCKEVERVVQKMDEGTDIDCITQHPGFGPVCPNRDVFDTAYYQYDLNPV